nr:tetratricopeptide repeat protein [uncultured Bacteroides sp.]
MRTYFFIFMLFGTSVAMAQQRYSPTAIAKNDEAATLYLHHSEIKDSLEKAFRLLDEAIAMDSTYIMAYNNKVNWLDILGKPEEALEIIDKAKKYMLDNPYWYGQRGILLDKLKRPKEAHIEYLQALQILEEKMKATPTPSDFYNYLFFRCLVDNKQLSDKEVEDLIPTSFTETERKDFELLMKISNPTKLKGLMMK